MMIKLAQVAHFYRSAVIPAQPESQYWLATRVMLIENTKILAAPE